MLTAAKVVIALDRAEARSLVDAAKAAFAEVGDAGERDAEVMLRDLGDAR